ncbi:hypothetical protein ORI89_18495 [Sphingobacterium sp. UT-1RO-CII-1]|uniref:hypothetical protein n=1 Tax=Sphingobacterium sp. UT-1RO-CII-1 TaxID=2995225 RepID=UPI00227B419E|nr:hypothetical protein [Sphingobacterium sp. UT-1RO-CII-1]MCY4781649.1 hypothetical protein [Sphingobacterium sp. UT-1RO-CII-1]
MNVVERAQAPTPKFFKILRNIGIVVATIGGAILTAPVALPAAIVTVGGYLAVAGGVISAISQVTVDDKQLKKDAEGVNDE